MNDNHEEFDRRRRQRSIVTALILLGFVALIYFIAMAKISGSQ
jgi:hypothetical protein